MSRNNQPLPPSPPALWPTPLSLAWVAVSPVLTLAPASHSSGSSDGQPLTSVSSCFSSAHNPSALSCLVQNERLPLCDGPTLSPDWPLWSSSPHTQPTVSLLFSERSPDSLVPLYLHTCCSFCLKSSPPKYPCGSLLYQFLAFTQMIPSQWVVAIHAA